MSALLKPEQPERRRRGRATPEPVVRPAFYRMTVGEFRRSAFLGRAPSVNTIKAAIRTNQWRGETIGGMHYIFVDAQGQPIPGDGSHAAATGATPGAPGTGNPEVDALIMEWERSK